MIEVSGEPVQDAANWSGVEVEVDRGAQDASQELIVEEGAGFDAGPEHQVGASQREGHGEDADEPVQPGPVSARLVARVGAGLGDGGADPERQPDVHDDAHGLAGAEGPDDGQADGDPTCT